MKVTVNEYTPPPLEKLKAGDWISYYGDPGLCIEINGPLRKGEEVFKEGLVVLGADGRLSYVDTSGWRYYEELMEEEGVDVYRLSEASRITIVV